MNRSSPRAALHDARGEPAPRFFLITGTGRCGTAFLAQLLSTARNGDCAHEAHFRHRSTREHYRHGDEAWYEHDIHLRLLPEVERLARQGLVCGVCSSHAAFAVAQLHQTFANDARYVLVVRRPDEFVRSALARGFFDPAHPHHCEQITPRPDDPIAQRWEDATPFEKCLWYWTVVNRLVLDSLRPLPSTLWRVIRMEDFSVPVLSELAEFLGLEGIGDDDIRCALSRGVNRTPGRTPSGEANPWSRPLSLGPVETWSPERRALLERYCGPLRDLWYRPTQARRAG